MKKNGGNMALTKILIILSFFVFLVFSSIAIAADPDHAIATATLNSNDVTLTDSGDGCENIMTFYQSNNQTTAGIIINGDNSSISGAVSYTTTADLTIWAGADDNGSAGDLDLFRNNGGAGVYDSYLSLNSGAVVMGVDGSNGTTHALSIDSDSVDINNYNVAGIATTMGSTNGGAGTVTAQAGTSSIAVATTGVAIAGGVDNNSGGITEAGAISGATTISANNTISTTGALSAGTTLSVTGQASLNGGITADSGLFTVTDGTGAVHTSSTLDVDSTANFDSTVTAAGLSNLNGGIAVDTNNFTVDGTSGAVHSESSIDIDAGATINGGATIYSDTGDVTTGNELIVDGTSARLANTTNTNSVAVNSTNTTVTGTTVVNGSTTITAATTANQAIVDATSSRFVSASGFTSSAVSNNSVSLIADTDASTANSRGQMSIADNAASLTVRTSGGVEHGLNVGQTSTTLSGGTTSTTITLNDTGATVSGGTFALNNNNANTTFSVVGSTGVVTVGNTTDAIAGTVNIKDTAGNNSIALAGSTGTATIGDAAHSGTVNVVGSSGTNAVQLLGTGTATFGNATDTAGTVNIDSASSANTISFAGSSATGTFGNATNAGTMYVTNGTGANTVALNGTGTSVIANGFKAYGSGTTAAGTGANMVINSTTATIASPTSGQRSVVVDDTSARLVSATNSNQLDVRENRTVNITDVNGATNTLTYGTRVEGGMYVNGSLGVSGNIYTLNSAANASLAIANNGLNITGSTNNVILQSDNNATLTDGSAQLNLTPTTGSLQVVNTTTGTSEGIDIGQTETVVSGGTHSTSLTLNDWGATFKNDGTGGPARVTGVADGESDFDAVNYRQLKEMSEKAYAGVATAMAMANIPAPVRSKRYSIGAGLGNYAGQTSFAVGAKAVVGKRRDVTVSISSGYAADTPSVAAGLGWSF